MGNCPQRKRSVREGDEDVLLKGQSETSQRSAAEKMLRVQFVTLGSGVAAEVLLSSRTTVRELRDSVSTVLGLPLENQRLVCGTVVLDDDCTTLCDLDLVARDVVEITVVHCSAQQALSGGQGSSLLLWDLQQRKLSKRLGGSLGSDAEAVHCLSVDWATLRALCGSGSNLHLWDLKQSSVLRTFSGHRGSVHCLSVDWAGKQAMSGCASGGICTWSLEASKPSQCNLTGEAPVLSLAAFWKGRRAWTGSGDCTLKLWNMCSLEVLREFRGHLGPVLCLSADWSSMRGLSGAGDGTLRLWDLESGESELFSVSDGHRGPVICVDADWTSARAVSGGFDGTLRLWNLESRDIILEFQGHKTHVFCVALDWPSGRVLSGAEGFTAEDPSTLKIWSLVRCKEPKAFAVEELRAPAGTGIGSSRCVAVNWTARLGS
eukprot:gb/GFBE01077899.1/.p1 GENE.gb/GFBE01077899.1/~~gb/GFBE01077899.1/.p1  ORF type:complete len:432 (+),score=53.55 gb/GFBE01077899.1/:1-1296(+)